EEFGIAPIEAMATGRPVIAYGRGALTETVVEGVSGLFFHEQSPEALVDALHRFEVSGFSPDKVRAQACRFGERVFRAEMTAFVAGALGERSGVRPPCSRSAGSGWSSRSSSATPSPRWRRWAPPSSCGSGPTSSR